NPLRCTVANRGGIPRSKGVLDWSPLAAGEGEPCQPRVLTYTSELIMNIRPLHDRVIVKRIEETETKRGVLYIPDSAKEKPQQGEVKAVGTGRLNEKGDRVAMEVKAGDRILFGKYGGSEVKVDGEEWVILLGDELLAVLD